MRRKNFITSQLMLSFLILVISMACEDLPAVAQTTPYVDTGFAGATPPPDPDLVIVREQFYGAEGIDLTPYGIGAGPVTFVQSIYFRFFVDNMPGTVNSFTGLVEFPPEIEIIGIITDGNFLGGVVDDGIASETDAVFGVGTNPDLYSELHRGFESLGGIGTSEFVNATSPQALVYGLNIEEGVDDFRVIIRYGTEFAPDLAFNVYAYEVGKLGGAFVTTGFRVGNDADPTVFGSGDWGEPGSILGIPLTAMVEPEPGPFIAFDPLANLFILRHAPLHTPVDGFDTQLSLPAPDLFILDLSFIQNPVGITDGNNGNLYVIDRDFGFGVVDYTDGTIFQTGITDQVGIYVDLTNLPGVDDLFILRDTATADSHVDRLETVNYTFTGNIPLNPTMMADPVAITDGADGFLYILGAAGSLLRIEPSEPTVTELPLGPPEGTYVDMTAGGLANHLFLLRQTPTGSRIDRYDLDAGVPTYSIAILDEMDTPAGLTDGPGGLIFVVGQGDEVMAALAAIDPADGTVVSSQTFMNFAGLNVSLTNVLPLPTPVEDTPRAELAGLHHWSAPNPFNARVTIHYEVVQPARVRVALYDLQGQLVKMLESGDRSEGMHTASWDGRDTTGRLMSSGTYLYRVEVGPVSAAGKVILAK